MRTESSTFYERKDNPREKANCLSALLFCYTIPVFMQGRKRDLDENDLAKPLKSHRSDILGEKIAIAWSAEIDRATRRKKEPSLTRVILKVFRKEIVVYGFICFAMEIIIRLMQPFCIGLVIRYFGQTKSSPGSQHYPTWLWRIIPWNYWSPDQSPIQAEEAWLYATGVVIIDLLVAIIFHPYMLGVLHVGMKMRVACCSLIYRKALRIKLVNLDGNTIGNAVNLMSNDVTRFDMAPLYFHYIWISPLQSAISIYFMYYLTGNAAFYGMITLVLFIPIQVTLGYLSSKYRATAARRTDERIRTMNEIIEAMQVIKMYAWENAFAKLIHNKRKQETNILLGTGFIKGIIMSFVMFTARLGIFLNIMMYVMQGGKVEAELVFVVGSFYMIIRQTMTVYFPQGIAMTAEATVSIKRIKHFLLLEEATVGDPTIVDPKYYQKGNMSEIGDRNKTLVPPATAKIGISRGLAKYGSVMCLENVNVEMNPGSLTVVVGPVGSGKTCLLQLILGELHLFSGNISVQGVISYAAQEPWLFVGSVRQNILFGREFEPIRYTQVVKACALQRDFKLFPYGDSTIIGERGASLSGGQRARVNLARAVYKKADIYLLDDPLSAVDIQVGAQLFEECVIKYLKNSGKIVVLITHQLQYLKAASRIMVLREGVMAMCGSYTSITKSGMSFTNLIESATGLASTASEEPTDPTAKVIRELSRTTALMNSVIDIEGVKTKKKPHVEAEIRTLGAIAGATYIRYFRAGGGWLTLIVMVLFFLGAQAIGSFGDYFIGEWSNVEEARSKKSKTVENEGPWGKLSTNDFINIYTIIIGVTVVVALTRSFYFFILCNRASIRLHDRMFISIIHATMRFFNNNPSGRILNRFSMDLGAVDELLPYAFIDTAQLMLNLCGAVVVIVFVNVWLGIPIVFMFLSYYLLRRFYLKTSRSVKRLEGVVRSSLYAHLTASVQGLPTIRSNGAEKKLVKEYDDLQDIHSSAWFMFLYTSRAFGFWADLVSTVFLAIVTVSFFALEDYYTAGYVGLIITQCIGLSGLIQWGLRQSAELENQMTSVERIIEFCNLEHEADLESGADKKPPTNWPKSGRIEFIKVFMRYSPLEPPVLKDLNFTIHPQEKIGIVGRTGAGKSSLIVTLFRLSYFEGTVLIDNLDISVLGLHDLRKKLSIIPQVMTENEPILFSGSMRHNLDPFGQYHDQEILKALKTVGLRSALTQGIACLDENVSEGGTNISVGERQMICLARAILRNNTILVLDEATANVDALTDKMIQTTIRTMFAQCTVLTIAHRLNTIMDSDKVIVMSAGVPVEFDHPYMLLQNKNGIFYDMVQRSGSVMAQSLQRIAKESYEVKKSTTKKKGTADTSAGPPVK